MVVQVARRAAASGASSVLIATDDRRIATAAGQHGFEAVMTDAQHPSGTDRIAEVAARRRYPAGQIVVNVQGDEPLISPQLVASVGRLLGARPDASVATACHPIDDVAALCNPNVVKVVLAANGDALYFSRAQIPYPREPGGVWYRHVGIYAYRVGFLPRYSALEPSPLERVEALEQLRVLWHGYRIAVAITSHPVPPGVDTPQDLEAVRKMLR